MGPFWGKGFKTFGEDLVGTNIRPFWEKGVKVGEFGVDWVKKGEGWGKAKGLGKERKGIWERIKKFGWPEKFGGEIFG